MYVFKVQYALEGPLSNPTWNWNRSPLWFACKQMFWFLACKQMCAEAIAQFQHAATWTLVESSLKTSPDGPRFTVWKNSSAGRSKRVGPFLLTPSEAQNISLPKTINMYMYNEIDSRGKPLRCFTYYKDGEDILQRLNSSISGCANLRHLSLDIYVGSLNEGTFGTPRTVFDFRWLGDFELPQIQTLTLTVQTNLGFIAVDPTSEHFCSQFDKAVTKVGMKLIGGSGTDTVTAPDLQSLLTGDNHQVMHIFRRVEKYVTKIEQNPPRT